MADAWHCGHEHLPRGSHWNPKRGQQHSHKQHLLHVPRGGGSSYVLENATTTNLVTQDGDDVALSHHRLEQIQSHSGWQLPTPSSGMLHPLPAVAPGGRSVFAGGLALTAAVKETAGGRRPLDSLLRDALRQTHKRSAVATSTPQAFKSSGIATEQWLLRTTDALDQQQQHHDHQHRPSDHQHQLHENQQLLQKEHKQSQPQVEEKEDQQQQQEEQEEHHHHHHQQQQQQQQEEQEEQQQQQQQQQQHQHQQQQQQLQHQQQHQQQQLQHQQQHQQLQHQQQHQDQEYQDDLPDLGVLTESMNPRPTISPGTLTEGSSSRFIFMSKNIPSTLVVYGASGSMPVRSASSSGRFHHVSGNRNGSDDRSDGAGGRGGNLARPRSTSQLPSLSPGDAGFSYLQVPTGNAHSSVAHSTGAVAVTLTANDRANGGGVDGDILVAGNSGYAMATMSQAVVASSTAGNHVFSGSAPATLCAAATTPPLLRPAGPSSTTPGRSSPCLANGAGSLTAAIANSLNVGTSRMPFATHPASHTTNNTLAAATSQAGSAAATAASTIPTVSTSVAANVVTNSTASTHGFVGSTVEAGSMSELLAQVADTLARQDEAKRERRERKERKERKRQETADKGAPRERGGGRWEGEGGLDVGKRMYRAEEKKLKEGEAGGWKNEAKGLRSEGNGVDPNTGSAGLSTGSRARQRARGNHSGDEDTLGQARLVMTGCKLGDGSVEGGHEGQGKRKMSLSPFPGSYSYVSIHPVTSNTATTKSSPAPVTSASDAMIGYRGGGSGGGAGGDSTGGGSGGGVGATAAGALASAINGTGAAEASPSALDLEKATADLLQYEAKVEEERIRRLRMQ